MDHFTRLEEDLLKDDSTTYTSSIATTVSVGVAEDCEELLLGAEANSFGEREDAEESTISTQKLKKEKDRRSNLIALKQIYCTIDPADIDVTYSAVTNVVDLIDARECDPDEILTNLGFADCHNEFKKRDILSRFQASPLLNNEDSRYLDVVRNQHEEEFNPARPHYNESIHKAQQWLEHHHPDDDIKERTDHQKSGSHTSALGKKASGLRQNKWRRFSKSRQSSFELLLPNLKEVDANQEAETPTADARIHPAIHTPIRESSMEVPATIDQIAQEKEISISNQDTINSSCVLSNNSVGERKDSVEPPPATTPTTNSEEVKMTRLFKTSLLLNTQRDSFELEEINSCNEDATDCCRQRRSGMSTLATSYGKHGATNYLPSSHSPNSEGGTDENESSSGFGEDETAPPITDFRSSPTACRVISPHTVIESIQQTDRCRSGAGSIRTPSSSTRYIYEVELGDGGKVASQQSVAANANDNNNARCIARRNYGRSVSTGTLRTDLVSLRCTGSWRGMQKRCERLVATPLFGGGEDERNACGKTQRIFADARRRRKEFAERSALSGDSIVEMLSSSSLLRQNGSYSVKVRRPGRYRCYSNSVLAPNGGQLTRDDTAPDASRLIKSLEDDARANRTSTDNCETTNQHSTSLPLSDGAIPSSKRYLYSADDLRLLSPDTNQPATFANENAVDVDANDQPSVTAFPFESALPERAPSMQPCSSSAFCFS